MLDRDERESEREREKEEEKGRSVTKGSGSRGGGGRRCVRARRVMRMGNGSESSVPAAYSAKSKAEPP